MPSNFINSIFHFNKFISWSNYDPHRIAKFTLISFAVHGRDSERPAHDYNIIKKNRRLALIPLAILH